MNNKVPHLMEVKSNEKIAKDTFKMVLFGEIDFNFDSGTFLNIKLEDGRFLLRRPISIFSSDEENKTVTIIYKIMGEGTLVLSEVVNGSYLDVMGPLGTGFPIQDDSDTVVLFGGGVGVPPLYELGKRLKAKGKKVISILGFRDEESIFAEEEFKELGDVYICTDDGSCGFHGNTVEASKVKNLDFDALYACGPTPMLKALSKEYKGKKKGWLSFEEKMACGIGACYGCMTETKNGLKRVCKDGPVFSLDEVYNE